MIDRKHRYDDCEPDECSVCWDKVRIVSIHSKNNEGFIGYISRYSSSQFRFDEIGEYQRILNYRDYKIIHIS